MLFMFIKSWEEWNGKPFIKNMPVAIDWMQKMRVHFEKKWSKRAWLYIISKECDKLKR